MILASLRISGRCVEIMSYNGSMIGGIYLKFDFDIRFRHLSHMLRPYVLLYARLFGSMRALLHAYLVGSIFCLSLRLYALPLCALGHNNGSDVCASSKCPDETLHLPRLF